LIDSDYHCKKWLGI